MTDFALLGEALVIDLLNTRPSTPDGPADLIADADGLRDWLAAQAGRLPDLPRPTAADLAAVHAVREHAGRALARVRAGDPPAAADVRALNAAMRGAAAYRVLRWGTPAEVSTHRDAPAGVVVAALLAEDAAELLAGPGAAAVRDCAAEDCTLLFVPAHPRRQWCSAARCGNRVRVARYYRRHRDG